MVCVCGILENSVWGQIVASCYFSSKKANALLGLCSRVNLKNSEVVLVLLEFVHLVFCDNAKSVINICGP